MIALICDPELRRAQEPKLIGTVFLHPELRLKLPQTTLPGWIVHPIELPKITELSYLDQRFDPGEEERDDAVNTSNTLLTLVGPVLTAETSHT